MLMPRSGSSNSEHRYVEVGQRLNNIGEVIKFLTSPSALIISSLPSAYGKAASKLVQDPSLIRVVFHVHGNSTGIVSHHHHLAP